jgi:hypothetical protein
MVWLRANRVNWVDVELVLVSIAARLSPLTREVAGRGLAVPGAK